ncbi:lck-interacting transmembrane adapter 1 isoform X1 [Columba livia]|uniref:lck-interacting transmembrane adapter 1 isoform X1 n=2 Tax=Columba livia TaxID=8932 RepID=UPI0031BA0595
MLKYLLSGGSDFNQGSFQSCGKFSDKKARQVGTDLLVIGERCAKATALGCRGVSPVLRWAQTTRSPRGCCSTRGSAGQGSSSPEPSSSLSPGLRDVSRAQSRSGVGHISPMAGGGGLAQSPLLPTGAALALLGLLVYLGALCAACRRKGRRKKVPPDGVKLVDESLLRQTQLRSLSKSDTKLHELYRVKGRNGAQRPASLDFLCPTAPPATGSLHSSGVSVLLHRELPQIPIPESPVTSPAPDQTYSNLLFTPLRKLVPDTVYECLAVGGEDAPVPPMPTGTQGSCPRAGRGAADYACVHKVKKTVPAEEQDGAVAGAPAAPQCWGGTGDSPQAKLEDMYSTVCKATKKKTQVPPSSPRAAREVGAGWPPPQREEGASGGCWSPAAPPDPCYESISDRAWTAQGRGPDPDYETVDVNWKKAVKRDKPRKSCTPENLYESVGDVWAGESRRASTRTAANGLEVYITNL